MPGALATGLLLMLPLAVVAGVAVALGWILRSPPPPDAPASSPAP
jgi:hypothetical protein